MHLFVVDVVALLPIAHFDLLAEVRSIVGSCQATAANLGACQYGQRAAVQLKKIFAMEDARMKMLDGGAVRCSSDAIAPRTWSSRASCALQRGQKGVNGYHLPAGEQRAVQQT